jgi:hypothetical protein
MTLKRLAVICILASFLAGCSTFYGSQPPAPVYSGKPTIQNPAVSSVQKTKPRINPSKEIVKTQPLREFTEIRPEPLPAIEQPFSESAPLETPKPLLPSHPIEAQELSSPSAEQLTPFEPIESTVPLSPVVSALVTASNQNSNAGDLDSAAVAIERAIRIEPRNATLFYKLALLRLKQSQPRLAEDLAKKSALLASTDTTLKKHCWLLIAHARELQQDLAGANNARERADSF